MFAIDCAGCGSPLQAGDISGICKNSGTIMLNDAPEFLYPFMIIPRPDFAYRMVCLPMVSPPRKGCSLRHIRPLSCVLAVDEYDVFIAAERASVGFCQRYDPVHQRPYAASAAGQDLQDAKSDLASHESIHA